MKRMVYLAGDIGGTHTRLLLFEAGKKDLVRLKETTFKSRGYLSLVEILKEFLKETRAVISSACFGIAGPVKGGKCQATNLPWMVDQEELEKELPIEKALLINDLEANAYGVIALPKEAFFSLNEGTGEKGNAALISAGTGLGEAGFYFDGKALNPFACEGGHCDFAPTSQIEIELLSYLSDQFDHISYERVLSGPGLYNIYRFFIESKQVSESPGLLRAIEEGDSPQMITEQGLSGKSQACVKSLELFSSIYGAEAGNLALKLLALQGVYIGGGIAPKLLAVLKQGHFFSSFKAKGRFSSLLAQIPIQVVLDEGTALLGAARCVLK